MEQEEIIEAMRRLGMERGKYMTTDICFDYDGSGYYPLQFPDWGAVEAFVKAVDAATGFLGEG